MAPCLGCIIQLGQVLLRPEVKGLMFGSSIWVWLHSPLNETKKKTSHPNLPAHLHCKPSQSGQPPKTKSKWWTRSFPSSLPRDVVVAEGMVTNPQVTIPLSSYWIQIKSICTQGSHVLYPHRSFKIRVLVWSEDKFWQLLNFFRPSSSLLQRFAKHALGSGWEALGYTQMFRKETEYNMYWALIQWIR